MALVQTSVNIRPNNGAQDNQLIDPTGGPVFFQINRGFNCVIAGYNLTLCTRNAAGGFQLIPPELEPNGAFPPPQNPNAPAPSYPLGAPAGLLNRTVVLLANSAALPPNTAGPIAVIVYVFQQLADGTFRRVMWKDDSATAVQIASRFEVSFLP